MAAKTTLNAKNLEALGAERLAALLIEVSTGDAAMKRRLRLELAGAQSPAEAAREIRKRLASIARGRTFIDWQKRRAFVADIEAQRRAIVDQVARGDPGEALDLLWQFLSLAGPVFDRCDDSSGTIGDEFRAARVDLGAIAQVVGPDPERLAERTFDGDLRERLWPIRRPDRTARAGARPRRARASQGAGHGLGAEPQSRRRPTRSGKRSAGRAPVRSTPTRSHAAGMTARCSWPSRRSPTRRATSTASSPRRPTRRRPCRLSPPRSRSGCSTPAGQRKPGRRSTPPPPTASATSPFEWQETRLAVMEALGMAEEAQAFRCRCFETFLNPTHLRASQAAARLRGPRGRGTALAFVQPHRISTRRCGSSSTGRRSTARLIWS